MPKRSITETTTYDSLVIPLWFSVAKGLGEMRMGLLLKGALNTGGLGKSRRFSISISLYLRNGARLLLVALLP